MMGWVVNVGKCCELHLPLFRSELRAASNFLLLSQSAAPVVKCKLNFKPPAAAQIFQEIGSFAFLFSFGTFFKFRKVKFALLLEPFISCKRALTSWTRWRSPTPIPTQVIIFCLVCQNFQTDVDLTRGESSIEPSAEWLQVLRDSFFEISWLLFLLVISNVKSHSFQL